MKMRMGAIKRWTKTEARRLSARKNANRGDPSNISADAFEIDRMRAYYRGRRPNGFVMRRMMRRWASEDDLEKGKWNDL